MMLLRQSLLAFALLLLATPLPGQDKEKKSRKDLFIEIRDDFNKKMQELQKGLQTVSTEKEYFALIKEKAPKAKEILTQLIPLAEEDPKDDLGLEILSLGLMVHTSEPVLTEERKVSPEARKVIKMLAGSHAAHPKMVGMMQALSGQPLDELKPLFEAVLANHADKSAKGFATFALANLGFESADGNLTAEARKTAIADAEKYFSSLVKDYADVEMGRTTLGAMAKPFLFELRSLGIGMKVPEATGENLEGKAEKLSAYQGKVVVLDIWATWCGPCRQMIPHSREMVKKLEGKPFALISVSADQKKATLEKFLEKEKMPWTHWWVGAESGLTRDWNVRFFPTIYVIDAKGVIRHKNIREEKLEEAVTALVKEAEGK